MENDNLSILDVENAVLAGEIVERQRDQNTSEWKYLIAGKTLDDESMVVVAKLGLAGDLVIITIFREKDEYETETTCANCGKPGARIIHVSRSYGKGTELLVIENVPVVSCPLCGESYLTAKTLREIDNIKRNRSKIASTHPVPVAAFAS